MKKVLLSLLAVIVVLGLFAAAGYAGYRIGYVQGVQSKITANGAPSNPTLRPFGNFNFGFGARQMPMRRFHDGRGFRRGSAPLVGFGFFPLIASLARALVLALLFAVVIGFIFWLFTRSGWRLTRATQAAAPPPPSTETSTQNENQDTEAKS